MPVEEGAQLVLQVAADDVLGAQIDQSPVVDRADTILNNTDLPITADSGTGNDKITSGPGNDKFYGETGDDYYNSRQHAGKDADLYLGGPGIDSADGVEARALATQLGAIRR